MKKTLCIIVPLLTFALGSGGGYCLGYYQSLHTREAKAFSIREITLPVSAEDYEPVWSGALAEHIGGEPEFVLRDRSRVDVLTEKWAIEVDWLAGGKWHQGIGQALHYAELSGKSPVLAIGIKSKDYDEEELLLATKVATGVGIAVWVLRAED